MAVPPQPTPPSPSGSTLANAPLPRRVREGLEAVFGVIRAELAPQMERMVQRLEFELHRQAESASGFHEEAARHTRHRVLHEHRNAISPRFIALVEAELAAIRAPKTQRDRAAEPSSRGSHAELRLLDHAEADEFSVLQTIARRHEARSALALQLLGQRFGVLAGAPALDSERLPVSPWRLAHSLADTCTQLGFAMDLRVAVLKAFDPMMQAAYPALAEAMNNALSRSNVLPGLSFVPLRPRAPSAPRRSGAHPAATPQTGWEPISSAADSATFDTLRQLLAERRSQAGKGPAADGSRKPALGTQEVVGMLAGMGGSAPGTSAARSVEEIRQALLLRGRHQNGGEATVLQPQDSDTFELLGMLYTEIAHELRQGASATAQMLQQLQVPLLRVALTDRGFFSQAQHPARQLLNAVAESGARWTSEEDADPQLAEQLKRAVEHVVEHADEDTAAFEAANQALQQQLQAMAKRAEVAERRHVEAMRGKEKLTLAKRRASEVIQQAISTLDLPHFARTLLTQAWADALTLTLLRHGADSDAWKQQMDLTAKLAASCHSGLPAEPAVKPQVEDALVTVGYHADDARRIAHRLTAGREVDEDPRSQEELASRVAERGRLGEDAEAAVRDMPPLTAEEQARLDTLLGLPFGTWFDFVRNQQGDLVRRRMSWMSRLTHHALFVNQRGQRVAEYTLDELARLMNRGQLRVVTVDEGRLVDRAWRSTLKALKGLVGAADPAHEGSDEGGSSR